MLPLFPGDDGDQPMAYLRHDRIEQAILLLGQGEDNIPRLSQKVGFQSPSYFIECFRKQTGVYP